MAGGENPGPDRPEKNWAQSLVDACINYALVVRWATGKRLTNRLPNLSLITLFPPF